MSTTEQNPPTVPRHLGNRVQLTANFRPVQAATVELIGNDEQVAQNQYGASAAIALRDANASGEIVSVTLEMANNGAGAVISEDGRLIFFNADPAVGLGDTTLTPGEGATILGYIDIVAADWEDETNLAYVTKNVNIPFEAIGNLYVAYLHKGATTLNDAAGDDESITAVVRYREEN